MEGLTLTRDELVIRIWAELGFRDEKKTEKIMELIDRYAKTQVYETLTGFSGPSYAIDDQVWDTRRDLMRELGLKG